MAIHLGFTTNFFISSIFIIFVLTLTATAKVPCLNHGIRSSVSFKIFRNGACLGVGRPELVPFRLQTIKGLSYWRCRKKCESWELCHSFDFYQGARETTCDLSKADRDSISRILGQSVTPVDHMDLISHGSFSCIHAEKYCKPAEGENQAMSCHSRVVSGLNECHCLQTPVGQPKHCLQKVKVIYFRYGEYNQCKRYEWRGVTACGQRFCDNIDYDTECEVRKRQDLCSVEKVASRCKRTCHNCTCGGTFQWKLNCTRDGFREVYTIEYRRDKSHGMCTAQIKSTVERCPYCSGENRTNVGPCENGTRVIELVKMQSDANGKCVEVRKSRVENCTKCLIPDQEVVGPCVGKNGNQTRNISVTYFIRRDSCCHKQVSTRVVGCNGCQKDEVKISDCFNGVRLRQMIYFNSFNKTCFRRVWTQQEPCAATELDCKDQLEEAECTEIKESNNCGLEDIMMLCRRTCNKC